MERRDFMLQRTDTIPGPPIGLQARVDRLAESLTPPRLSDVADLAKREFVAAGQVLEQAQAELAEAAKAFAAPLHGGESPEVTVARATVASATKAREAARQKLTAASAQVSAEFCKKVLAKLETAGAGVLLLDLAALLHEAAAPLVDLHLVALRAGHSMPRLVAIGPELQQLAVRITQLANMATAPAPAPVGTDE
jgi:hypothetical protein